VSYEIEIRREPDGANFPWYWSVRGDGLSTYGYRMTRLGAKYAVRQTTRRHRRGAYEAERYTV
jgi:hypothetical protein